MYGTAWMLELDKGQAQPDSLYADLDVTNPQVNCTILADSWLAHSLAVNNNAPVQLLSFLFFISFLYCNICLFILNTSLASPRRHPALLFLFFLCRPQCARPPLGRPPLLSLAADPIPSHSSKPDRVESKTNIKSRAGQASIPAIHETSLQSRCLRLIREHLQSPSQVRVQPPLSPSSPQCRDL